MYFLIFFFIFLFFIDFFPDFFNFIYQNFIRNPNSEHILTFYAAKKRYIERGGREDEDAEEEEEGRKGGLSTVLWGACNCLGDHCQCECISRVNVKISKK